MLNKKFALAGLLTLAGQVHALTVHEWGTFTSLVGSDGRQQFGLHHEEEGLPNFVYDLASFDHQTNSTDVNSPAFGGSGLNFPPTRGFAPPVTDHMPVPTFTQRVNQKMETPVLYFHTDKQQEVEIQVKFPQGVISQWFPNVSQVNKNAELSNGFANWKIKLSPYSQEGLPPTLAQSIWNPSRQVRSNTVETQGERERFIFYRGLGRFQTELQLKIEANKLNLSNLSAQTVPYAILLENRGGQGRFYELGAIPSGQKALSFDLSKRNQKDYRPFSEYIEQASEHLFQGLKATGLYADEARSMLNTWKKSYFHTEGLRLLYILPQTWTDQLLPIQISPAPKSLVRTLVGRVEILTPEDEQQILQFVQEKVSDANFPHGFITGRELPGLGHFPEPKLRRAQELLKDPNLKKRIDAVITQMNRGLLFQ